MNQGRQRLWGSKGRGSDPAESPAYACVVDPGSTTLRVLVVELGAERAVVWGWDERATDADSSASGRALVKGFEAALARSEGMAHDRAERWLVSDQMVVGLPASQIRGGGWPVAQRRAQPDRPVEEGELEALLARALRLAVNRLKGLDERHWLLLDAVPVALTVDGRRVTDPVGFRARELGATVFVALAPEQVVKTWRGVAEALDFATLTLTAAPLALASGMVGAQGIALDVGGTATDLTWWRAGRPLAVDSLPLGGASLTEALQRRWGLPAHKAESIKRAYSADRLTAEARAEVLEPMRPAVRAWQELAEATLAEMGDRANEPLPGRLLLCGGGVHMPEVVEAARSLARSARLSFERPPQVDLLRPDEVAGVFNRTDLGRDWGDSSALLLAAWAGRQTRPPDRPSQIVSRLSAG